VPNDNTHSGDAAMADRSERESPLHGLFKDYAEALAESGIAPGLVSPELVQRALTANRALLHRFQAALGPLGEGEEPAAARRRQQELAKATLLCWLELGKAFRTYRDNVFDAQTALLTRYFDLIDQDADACADVEDPKRSA
jgi:hypothetical protein